ncbi:uncharacterized protein TNCV_2623891 [Trichonephila clavipes]|nr:uncharacterized protein TNCV_2623891 [Trichonephila clavipes]
MSEVVLEVVNTHHESYRAVLKSERVRGDGKQHVLVVSVLWNSTWSTAVWRTTRGELFSTARSKAYQLYSIMLMSGDFGGQWKCLNLKEGFWSPSVAILDVWGVILHCSNSQSPSECTMDMNGGRVHGFMRLSPCPYTSISSIQLETRLVISGNVFPVIDSPISVLMGPGEE